VGEPVRGVKRGGRRAAPPHLSPRAALALLAREPRAAYALAENLPQSTQPQQRWTST
jgi:hypothetical protein